MIGRVCLTIIMLAGAAFGAGPVVIDTAHGSVNELSTKAELEKLIAKYDLEKWSYTRKVVVDENSIPHSHPILTLHTRHLGSDNELLSTYVHEQLHWYLDARLDETNKAIEELKAIYKNVPVGYPEGANDEESTYLHLLVCYDEGQLDRQLIGDEAAHTVMQHWSTDHYRWVYRTVLQDETRIGAIVNAHQLLPQEAR